MTKKLQDGPYHQTIEDERLPCATTIEVAGHSFCVVDLEAGTITRERALQIHDWLSSMTTPEEKARIARDPLFKAFNLG